MLNKLRSSGRPINGLGARFCAVLGAQWGDEGKGKLIDILADHYDVVARFNGGANAGHTIKIGQDKYFFHLIPSGILHPKTINIVGNGCVVDPRLFIKELDQLDKKSIDYKGRLFISENTHVTLEGHLAIEKKLEEKLNIGTTKKGIGTTYAAKALRFGLRMGDLRDEKVFLEKYKTFCNYIELIFGIEAKFPNEVDSIRKCMKFFRENGTIIETSSYLSHALRGGKRLLAEGANGALLDIDHGSYPYVTSSNTTSGGILTGLGLPPSSLEAIVGVVKAYTTRVGEGPFPSEFDAKKSEIYRKKGGEFGVTTGRARRCGYLDLDIMRKSCRLNGYSSIMVTKLDILGGMGDLDVLLEGGEKKKMKGWEEDISKARKFEELPKAARDYVTFIEEYLETPVTWIGVGPARDEIVKR